jgi:ABC-type sugar transport system ATPase subunit
MSTIEIRKVTKKFGDFTAVRDADLSVAAGEVVCLLGPSGCGKTTTLRMIAGLERATAGDVVIAGQRMNELPPEKRDIAMVFQFYALYPALTVRQNIAMPLHYEGIGSGEMASRITRVAGILHLTEILDRLPGQVSEGEKQRIAVARAIVRDPNCFLFDEPLSRLDVELRHSMRGQIKAVLSNLSKATVIVTHDQLEALTMADKVAVMEQGVIIQESSPLDIYQHPDNRFVAGFIGQSNFLEGKVTAARTGNGMGVVETAFGALKCHLANGIKQGDAVTIAVRPEDVLLSAEAGPGADNVVEGEIATVVFLGESQECLVRLGQSVVRFKVHPTTSVARGQAVKLSLTPDKCRALAR